MFPTAMLNLRNDVRCGCSDDKFREHSDAATKEGDRGLLYGGAGMVTGASILGLAGQTFSLTDKHLQ